MWSSTLFANGNLLVRAGHKNDKDSVDTFGRQWQWGMKKNDNRQSVVIV